MPVCSAQDPDESQTTKGGEAFLPLLARVVEVTEVGCELIGMHVFSFSIYLLVVSSGGMKRFLPHTCRGAACFEMVQAMCWDLQAMCWDLQVWMRCYLPRPPFPPSASSHFHLLLSSLSPSSASPALLSFSWLPPSHLPYISVSPPSLPPSPLPSSVRSDTLN